jgi:hypothetical protein
MRHGVAAIRESPYAPAIGWTAITALAGLVDLSGFRHASILAGVFGVAGVSIGFRLFDYGCSATRPLGVRVLLVIIGFALGYLGMVLVEVMFSERVSEPGAVVSMVLGASIVSSVLAWLGLDEGPDEDLEEEAASGR